MLILVSFAFIAGIVTILSPCILPVLPIVLSGGIGEGKKRPLGVVCGFILSFTFFTLALSVLVKLTGVSADALRTISIAIIFFFGVSLLVPQCQKMFEKIAGKLSGFAPTQTSSGFGGGFVLGVSLGLIWTPCVGPIIASVITLVATTAVTYASALITFSYAAGTAIPMLFITYGGRELIRRVPWLMRNTVLIQKVFGVLMIFLAVGIYFNFDRKFQSYILKQFPNYGAGLTQFEDTEAVKKELQRIATTTPSVAVSTAPDFIAGGEWINSSPLSMASLRGKVVLVDFWTYTCINCIRTLPYLKSWHQKYEDKGLVIVGVHTPEFEFEKNIANVRAAVRDFGITYPVMQDNDYATWSAYRNRYWPAKYFIDKKGVVRSRHFGEGAYDESEKLIQELLSEDAPAVAMPIDNPRYRVQARTLETYLGYARIENFASPEKIARNTRAVYTAPPALARSEFAYIGAVTIGEEYATLFRGSKLRFHFDAQNAFLVMRAPYAGTISVFLDGKKWSTVTVNADRLYELIKLPQAGDHQLELEFETDGIEVYAFTFG